MASRNGAAILSRALRTRRTPQLPRAAVRSYSTSESGEKRPSIVVAYWGWTTLEQDEIREEKKKEIESLEAKVAELQTSK
ncbi:hypothetical protein COL26b_000322 [Colletotrichum chrysophilum]|uniref:uncharacterized protein n=1 Tax=Colletotrichum chrysophilum TaxID=1836956 RepID=UPI002300EED8|nr:uncharacterized protein COL26b_000322 [Colletotrichum chrysophilum]KAJ0381644.1 hypothetical protein COL26b_000322 [Colletotrichum chrysophilum]